MNSFSCLFAYSGLWNTKRVFSRIKEGYKDFILRVNSIVIQIRSFPESITVKDYVRLGDNTSLLITTVAIHI